MEILCRGGCYHRTLHDSLSSKVPTTVEQLSCVHVLLIAAHYKRLIEKEVRELMRLESNLSTPLRCGLVTVASGLRSRSLPNRRAQWKSRAFPKLVHPDAESNVKLEVCPRV